MLRIKIVNAFPADKVLGYNKYKKALYEAIMIAIAVAGLAMATGYASAYVVDKFAPMSGFVLRVDTVQYMPVVERDYSGE